ncbi:DNA polymerase III subunit gamma/tau, partial [Prevotella histicola]
AHVIFILATTEKHKILPTILSRCQIYDFERMTVRDIIGHLKSVAEKENIKYDEQALNVIAEKADGGMRDALSIFDQAASFSQGDISYQKVIEDLNVLDEENYFNIIDLALENKVSEIMVLLNTVINKGFDGGNLINGLASHVRNVLMAKDAQTLPLLEVSDQQRQRYQSQAQKCPTPFLYDALKIMNRCDVEYRQSSNKRLLVELTLIEVAQITQKEDDVPASGRSPKRLKSLFKKLIMKAQIKPTPQVVGSLKRVNAASQGVADGVVSPVKDDAAPKIETSITSPKPVPTAMSGSLNLGSLGMSFDNLLKSKDKKPAYIDEPEVTNKEENESFSQQDLVVQWRSMCSRMPSDMQALAQRMKNITPTITEFPHIQVLAENKIQLNELLSIKARIRATLAKTLHNGQLELTIRLAEQDEIKPMLTPRQELEKLKQTNKPVMKLIEALGLELA